MMAQTEDTELRDLVIDALEKNGSLAKIRALLRANVFLAFDDECANIKQNVSLDNILKLPEGILSLSIVHEFLEYCNLKNTLFVYMSESRQRTEYVYEGQKKLSEKLSIFRDENNGEPILVTLIKNILKPSQRKFFDQGDTKTHEKVIDNGHKDDQNCTYIVHEDTSSSAASNSQSDSSDERNKLHLRLQLDNSDTDTSSDSTRDKSSSEYIPNEHVIVAADNNNFNSKIDSPREEPHQNLSIMYNDEGKNSNCLHELKLSSDSTSYVELKPYNPLDKEMLNTTGIPFIAAAKKETINPSVIQFVPKSHADTQSNSSKLDSASSNTLHSVSSMSMKNEDEKVKGLKTVKNLTEEPGKSDPETVDYSNDFTSSPRTRNKELTTTDNQARSPQSVQDKFVKSPNKISSLRSPHQNSQSSISVSDVADLLSEKSSSFSQQMNNENNWSNNKKSEISTRHHSNNTSSKEQSKHSDDSIDCSESPVPSLSNLSLDIHSD